MGLTYLIIYTVISISITVSTYIRKENIIYRALWTEYSVSAVFCVINCLNRSIVGYSNLHNIWFDLNDTTLWGYLLLLLCNIIAFIPFKIINSNNEFETFGKQENEKRMFSAYAYLYIVLALIFIIPSISFISSILSVSDYGLLRETLFNNSENEAIGVSTTNFISNICYKICLEFKVASIFIAFGMLKEKEKPWLATILLIVTFFVYYISCSSMAARGGMLIFTFAAFVIGLLFFKYLSNSTKRRVVLFASALLAIVLSFFVSVSLSRLANSVSEVDPLLRNTFFYLGHGPIEFSKITGSLNDFAYGQTIIGRLSSHYFGTYYSWDSIVITIGFPNIGPVFVTYLGYIYTDFGAIGCIVFTSIWSYATYSMLKNRPRKLSTIYFFSYYLLFYITGNFTAGRLEYASLITTIVIYTIMRLMENNERQVEIKNTSIVNNTRIISK